MFTAVPKSSIAVLLVLTMFSTVLGQPLDCGQACGSQGCATAGRTTHCCGSCGDGPGCECRKANADSAGKACCSTATVAVTRNCCTSKGVTSTPVTKSQKTTTCGAGCQCARSAQFPTVPLEQQSKVADSLKLPVLNVDPLLAVIPSQTEFALGRVSPDDSPPPRAGSMLRLWICSWTT